MESILEFYQKNPKRYNTDKGTYHCFLEMIYEDIFSTLSAPCRILEIGVGSGGSMHLFSDYLQEL